MGVKIARAKRIPGLCIGLAGLAMAALAGSATEAKAQIQLTPDSGRYLIQRFVAPNEQWAISYNFADGTLTGNVFKTDGQDPSFIWCEFTDIQYADDPADNSYTLDCFGSNPCTEAPCEESAWVPIGTGIPLPASFVLPPDTQATFGGQIEPIFTQTCALAGCHDTNSQAGELDLSAGAAYDNLVEVMSSQRPAEARITPFDPDMSYLYSKIIGTGDGAQMPMVGMLSAGQMQDIFDWITEGATRN